MMETATETTIKDNLLELLQSAADGAALPAGIVARRDIARERLNGLSVPNLRHEEWKYSDMERVLGTFNFVLPKSSNHFETGISDRNSIYLHNGRIEKVELTPEAKESLVILPLGPAMEQYPEMMEKYLGSLITPDDFFSNLNMAFPANGIFLFVKDNAKVKDPVFMYQDCYDEKEMYVQSHNLVVVGKNASLTVIKKQVCSGNGARVFHNMLSELILEEGAEFSFNRLQNECKDTYQVTYLTAGLKKDARLDLTNIAIGGSFTRNNFHVALDGSHSNARLTGLTILNGKQHSDSWVNIRHNMPECESDQLFKSIVNDESTSAFSGKIFVARDAQKTNAYQSNKNIVLTEKANAYSKPQLEIYADDVKCSHGSTTGQIDEEGLFYLRARGIKEAAARKLLLYAFAENIVDRLGDENFRSEVHDMIHQKFN